jgi:hypothetical protein
MIWIDASFAIDWMGGSKASLAEAGRAPESTQLQSAG